MSMNYLFSLEYSDKNITSYTFPGDASVILDYKKAKKEKNKFMVFLVS
jgi:hypothetical protein